MGLNRDAGMFVSRGGLARPLAYFCAVALVSCVMFASSAASITDPIVKASSGAILQTDKGARLVLYGIDPPAPGTDIARSARAFTTEAVVGKNVTIEVVKEKYGVTYVKVTLSDKSDLTEQLLLNGLATWNKAEWPDLKRLGDLQQQGKDAQARKAAEAEKLSAAQRAATQEQMRKEEAARLEERRKREWAAHVEEWKGMSPEQRQQIRLALQVRKQDLDTKVAKARKLENLLVAAREALKEEARDQAQAKERYRRLKQAVGPDFFTEFALEEWDDDHADAKQAFQQLVNLYNTMIAEINVQAPAFEQESQQVAALDAELPGDGGASEAASGAPAGDSCGTGFAIGGDLVMTCAHVVGNAAKVQVRTRDGKFFPAAIVAEDAENDWCVLRVKDLLVPAIPIAQSRPATGSTVYCLGYPLGDLMASQDPVAGSGNIAALQGVKGDKRHLQITVPINQGSSGSPIINGNGEWVGLASHKFNDMMALTETGSVPQGLNFAVKADIIQPAASAQKGIKFHTESKDTPMTLEEVVQNYSNSVVLVVASHL